MVTQTVEIPASRRIMLDVPQDIPVGKARISIFPIAETQQAAALPASGKIRLTQKELDEMLENSPITRELTGILSDLGDITIEQIRLEKQLPGKP